MVEVWQEVPDELFVTGRPGADSIHTLDVVVSPGALSLLVAVTMSRARHG